MHKNNLQIFEELTLSEEACTVGGHSRRGVYHPRRDFRNLTHYSIDCATTKPNDLTNNSDVKVQIVIEDYPVFGHTGIII